MIHKTTFRIPQIFHSLLSELFRSCIGGFLIANAAAGQFGLLLFLSQASFLGLSPRRSIEEVFARNVCGSLTHSVEKKQKHQQLVSAIPSVSLLHVDHLYKPQPHHYNRLNQ